MRHLLRRFKALRTEAVWLAAGQLAIAVGGMVGIALLTNMMDAATFGALTLYVGIAAFAMSMLINPIVQAGMRFFASAGTPDQYRAMRRITLQWMIFLLGAVCAILVLAGWVAENWIGAPAEIMGLVAVLLCVDAYRVYETSALNAAREQRAFVLWRAADAWMRPILAAGCVALLGVAAWPGLLGYAAATASVCAFFVWATRPKARALAVIERRPRTDRPAIDQGQILRYAAPLVPVGALGWVLGSGDRYIIGGLLSLEAAGLYAAIYAITSRPFTAIGSLLDVLLRPRLYDAGAAQNWAAFNRIFLAWLAATVLMALPLILVALFWAAPITRFLLGPDFADSAMLMPWIALGYAVKIVFQPLQRVLHTYLLSGMTLLIQAVTTAVGLAATVAGIYWGGLLGAAMAIPAYFGFRLIFTLLILRRSDAVRETFLGGLVSPAPFGREARP